ATMTVFHNGVLVHDHATLTGPTSHKKRPPYRKHPGKLPLRIQDHGDPVGYRSIWVRPLE
ncbi:MAG: family 16 glycoside hydrolase, partial [Phycisphaeraceae bacterium]|nr:family 16 glycoside hydrolase [Phycisphaeraceae bacterium]